MLCDICKQNVATVHLTQMVEGKTKKVDLCEACSKEKGVDDPTGFSLADLLLGLGAAQEMAQAAAGSDLAALPFTWCVLGNIPIEEQIPSLLWFLLKASLFLIGALSTIPLVFEVFGGQRLSASLESREWTVGGPRTESDERLGRHGVFAQS